MEDWTSARKRFAWTNVSNAAWGAKRVIKNLKSRIKRVRSKPVSHIEEYNSANYSVKKDDYRLQKKDDLEEELSKIDPFFHGDGGYIEIHGEKIPSSEAGLAKAFVDRLNLKSSQSKLNSPEKDTLSTATTHARSKSDTTENGAKETQDEIEEVESDLKLAKGVHLIFSLKRIFFSIPINQVTSSVITVHNRGTMAVHFEWQKVKKANPLNV